MPKLSDTTIRAATGREKPYKLSDGRGLVLEVFPNGSKLWRVRFTLARKERTFVPGRYPDVSLEDARQIAISVKKEARAGRDPVRQRQAARSAAEVLAAQTFELVARDWLRARSAKWGAARTAEITRILAKDVFPRIGKLPVGEVTGLHFTGTIERPGWFDKLTRRAPTIADECQKHVRAIYAYAGAKDWVPAGYDPARGLPLLCGEHFVTNHPAATDIATARRVLAVIEAEAQPMVALAHRFLVLTGVRLVAAIAARWSEVADLDGARPCWTVPPSRNKAIRANRRPHDVPLCPEAVDVLRAARDLGQYTCDAIFTLNGRKCLGESTLGMMARRCELPVAHVLHGWRTTMDTILNELHPEQGQVIEVILGHKIPGVKGIYNRAAYYEQRVALHAEWGKLILQNALPAWQLAGLAMPHRKPPLAATG